MPSCLSNRRPVSGQSATASPWLALETGRQSTLEPNEGPRERQHSTNNPPAAMAHISPTQFARKTRQCQYFRDRISGRSR